MEEFNKRIELGDNCSITYSTDSDYFIPIHTITYKYIDEYLENNNKFSPEECKKYIKKFVFEKNM